MNSKGVKPMASLSDTLLQLLLIALLLWPALAPAASAASGPETMPEAAELADLHDMQTLPAHEPRSDADPACDDDPAHHHPLADHCCQPGCSTSASVAGGLSLAVVRRTSAVTYSIPPNPLAGVKPRRYRPPKTVLPA